MTVTTLAQAIRHLPSKDQAKLFDRLGPSLEDYLLTKIAQDRFKKTSPKHFKDSALASTQKRHP